MQSSAAVANSRACSLPVDAGTGGEFIAAGHSHLFALGAPRGYRGSLGLSPVTINGRRGYFLMDEDIRRPAAYWDALVAHAKNRRVLLVFRGNQHQARFMVAPDPLFDFVDVSGPHRHPYPGATIVPRRLVKEFFARGAAAELRMLIQRLQDAGALSIVVMGTPPPRSDIANLLDSDPRVATRVAQRHNLDLDSIKIIPAAILQKMWRLVQEIMEETARETGVHFLAAAAQSLDSSGFLAERFRRPGDATHANEEYGQIMLESALRIA